MVIELNGLSFHLRLSGDDQLRAHIVDEAFCYEEMSTLISGPACVLKLIERYSGLVPDEALAQQVAKMFREKPKVYAKAA